jgi:hypothetical protein
MYTFFSKYEIDGTIKINKMISKLNIFITPWSISHFVTGYMAKLFGLNYMTGLICHTIYEYRNYSSKPLKIEWSKDWYGFKTDSIFNSIGDTVVFLLGMFLAKNYNNWYFFIFIFLLGVLFYSPMFQSYLIDNRLYYLQDKGYKLNLKNVLYNKYEQYLRVFKWIIASVVTLIIIKKNIKLHKLLYKLIKHFFN